MAKYENILKNLIEIYNEFLPYKEIFSIKKDFKYEEKDLKEMFEFFTGENIKIKDKPAIKPVKKEKSLFELLRPNPKDKTYNLQTREDAENFYFENMVYDRNDNVAEKKVIDKYVARDLDYIYFLLYNVKPGSGNKTKKLQNIQKYFDNIKRASRL